MTTGTLPKGKIGTGRTVVQNRYERKFRRGSLIFIEGESSTEMFIIRAGRVRILKQEGENTFELAVLGPGSVLGELSLLDHQPRGATAQVVEDVTATVIDEELLQRTLEKIPSWLSNIIHVVVKRLRDTMKRTSDDVVRSSVAGTVRVLLLCAYGGRCDATDGMQRLPLAALKERVYATIGLGGMECEKVLLHLILKNMLYIRPDERGVEYAVVRDLEVLQLYMTFLRARQRGAPMVGERFSPAAAQLLGVILESGEHNGRVVEGGVCRVGVQQIAIAQARRGGERHIDPDALDELFAARVVAKDATVTTSAHGKHAFEALLFNKGTLQRICLLLSWIDLFREDVLF